MRKVIELEDRFYTGEATIQPAILWHAGRPYTDAFGGITKHASDALDYIKNVVPEPGKTHLLLLAMGGEEAYGPNRNGDGFPARPVPAKLRDLAPNARRDWRVAPGDELTKHYQSFEKNPAHTFKHHANKDKAKASGHVKKAFWNDKMQRVELLVVIDNEKDAEWVERVNSGEFPPVSMGCRIKHDVCSRCGNLAPTREDYCKHARHEMNRITPEGEKTYVHNPAPDFFDISRVFRPADRIGYTMKKVADFADIRLSADLGAEADDRESKAAAIRKLSDILKVVRGEPVASSSDLGDGDRLILQKMRGDGLLRDLLPPAKVASCVIGLSLPELIDGARNAGIILPATVIAKTAAHTLLRREPTGREVTAVLALHSVALDLFTENPHFLDEIESSGILGKGAASSEKTASAFEMMYRKTIPEGIGIRPDAGANTDLIQYTDPRTQQAQLTTRGAALEAQDAQSRHNFSRGLGGAALLLGGYHALTGMPGLSRKIRWPLAAAAGYTGMRLLQPSNPTIYSDSGLALPASTEFAPQAKFSSAQDNLAPLMLRFLCDAKDWCAAPTIKVATPAVADLDAAIDFLETLST